MSEREGLASALEEALAPRYEVHDLIGRGGMATVYGATDRQYGRPVAIKVLQRELAGFLGIDRFRQEIRFAGSLQHPNILPILDDGEVDGLPLLVMPLMEEGSLADRIREEGALPLEVAHRIAVDACDGLAHAHAHDIVHRDVKPGNILLSAGRAVVSDFGIARALATAGGERLTSSGITIGTPQYMSPEQTQGTHELDGRSDLYSLGCVIYEMLAGTPPFDGPPQAIAARHLLEPPPPLKVVRPALDEGLIATVEKLLAKSPADRFESAMAARQALDEAFRSSGVVTRPPWLRPAWIAATVATLAVAGWGLTRLGSADPVLEQNRVLVLPLVEEGSSAEGAGYDVALMIGTALEHAEPLGFIDGRDDFATRQAARPQDSPDEIAVDLAMDVRAGRYLTGVVRTVADSTTVVLRLRDPTGSDVIQESETGHASVPPYQLGLEALRRLLPRLLDPGRQVDLTPLTGRDHGAFALFVFGQRSYLQARFGEAAEYYQRAVAEDSAFAYAAIKGAQAASWIQGFADAEALSELAHARESDLPPKYRAFAAGLGAYFGGHADSAVAAQERALAIDPDWSEAHMALGEVYYHLLPDRAPLDSLAEATFRLALGSDTTFTPPLYHLAEIAIREGDVEAAGTLLARFARADPEVELLTQLDLMLDCVRSGAEDWRIPEGIDPFVLLDVASALSHGARQADCAERAFRDFLDRGIDRYDWLGLVGLQSLLVARGRDAEASAALDSAVSAGQSYPRFLYIIDAIAGADLGDRADASHEWVVSNRGERLEGASPLTYWALGSWYAERGRTEWLELARSSLAAAAAADSNLLYAELAEGLEAQELRVAGQRDAAIERLRALETHVPPGSLTWGFAEPLAVERFVLASLLLEAARYDEAARVASAFDHPNPILFLPFVPQSLRIRYEAARATGREELAARYRTRLDDLGRSDLLDPSR